MTLNDYRLRLADWIDAHLIRSALAMLAAVLAIVVLVTFCAARAAAADVRVEWTQPTHNTDGTEIPATGNGRLTGNRVEWGSCNGTAFGAAAGSQTIAPATSHVVTGLPPAMHCFRVYAANSYGVESAASAVTVKAVPPPTPNAPVIVSATIARVMAGKWVGAVVGRVDLGTACGKQRSGTWHEVERSDVALNRYGRSLPRGAVIVAQCG